MNGNAILWKRIRGLAMAKATSSAFCMATVLGASSPTTTFKKVIRENAMIKDKIPATLFGICNSSNKGSINL